MRYPPETPPSLHNVAAQSAWDSSVKYPRISFRLDFPRVFPNGRVPFHKNAPHTIIPRHHFNDLICFFPFYENHASSRQTRPDYPNLISSSENTTVTQCALVRPGFSQGKFSRSVSCFAVGRDGNFAFVYFRCFVPASIWCTRRLDIGSSNESCS